MRLFAFAACLLLLCSGAALARPSERDLKVLRESAAALANSNPRLAQRLRGYADREAAQTETQEAAQRPTEEQDLKLVYEAAGELKDSRPDLYHGLDGFTKRQAAALSNLPPATR